MYISKSLSIVVFIRNHKTYQSLVYLWSSPKKCPHVTPDASDSCKVSSPSPKPTVTLNFKGKRQCLRDPVLTTQPTQFDIICLRRKRGGSSCLVTRGKVSKMRDLKVLHKQKNDTHYRKHNKSVCIKWYFTVNYIKLSFISSSAGVFGILSIFLCTLPNRINAYMLILYDMCNNLKYTLSLSRYIYIHKCKHTYIKYVLSKMEYYQPTLAGVDILFTSAFSLRFFLIRLPVLYPVSFP